MITLVILTYRNPEHLNRALLFYKKCIPYAKIVIVDSNSEENKKKNREYIESVTTITFIPLHLEYDETISFSEKVAKSIDSIVTPYCILVGDDDFFSPQGIMEAIQFLENFPEYVFAYGHQYGFIFENEELKWYCSGYYENPRSFSQDDPLERLDSYLEKYASTFYSVFRTNILKTVIKQSYIYAPCLVFFDNMLTMQVLMRGKGYFLNKPFCFKEMSNLSTSVIYNVTWFLGKDFEKNKKLMEKGLEENFKELLLVSEGFAKKRGIDSANRFMETTFYSLYPAYQSMSFLTAQKENLKKYIPLRFKKKLLMVKDFIKNKTIDMGQEYLFDKNSPYAHEFEEVSYAIRGSGIKAYKDGFENEKQL